MSLRRWLGRTLIALTAVGVLAAAAAAIWVYRVVLPGLPTAAEIRDMHMQEPLRVYAAGGELIAEYGTKQRIPVPYERIPKRVRDAFLAAEDANFFHEPGVSWKGLIRAAIHLALTGRRDQGGSTITMQVARNFFLTKRKTYARKAREILVALRINRLLTKQQILDLYLNKIYLGQGAYGIQAAARVYYGTDITQLTLPQIAMIAGLPQAPSAINPIADPKAAFARRAYVLRRMRDLGYITDAQYRSAVDAPLTATVHSFSPQVAAPYVGAMVRDAAYQRFGAAALTDGYKIYTTIDARMQAEANHALRWDLLRYSFEHGYRGPEAHLDGALTPATMDPELKKLQTIAGLIPGVVVAVGARDAQVYLGGGRRVTVDWKGLSWARPYIDPDHTGPEPTSAGQILKPGDVVRVERIGKKGWRLAQIPKVQGALVALAPRDGAIRALVGGFSFRLSKFNRVTQAYRQPGSSFKPFVYSAALAKGFTLATLINDAPVVLPAGEGFDWRPEDYEKTFRGPVLLQTGLAESLNLVSIRLLQDIGVDYARQYAARFGFDPQRIPDNLTLVLGSGSITPLESARAYSVFANGGFRIKPWFIDRIVDQQGNVVFQAQPEVACPECPVSTQPPSPASAADAAQPDPASVSTSTSPSQVASTPASLPEPAPAGPMPAPRAISPQNDYLMVQMLHQVILHGTGRAARALGRSDLAGKTGTTNRQRDAWFAGFNPSLVTVAWVGFDHLTPLGRAETGARAALPMWMAFMRAALKGTPERFLPRPPGLVTVRIDPQTGKPAGIDDPGAVFITFRARYAPTVQGQGGAPPPAVPHLF